MELKHGIKVKRKSYTDILYRLSFSFLLEKVAFLIHVLASFMHGMDSMRKNQVVDSTNDL
jgi:hypothetical protein